MISRAKLTPVLLGGGADIGTALRTSLISWWTLNEASTGVAPVTRNDSHGTNHLTDVNTTASGTGKVGNGADVEVSSNEWLTIADNDSLSMGDIDFTICAWVKFESGPNNLQTRAIVSKYGIATNHREYSLVWERIDASAVNHFRFVVSNDGTAFTPVPATTFGNPTTGTWYFVVGWHDATANTINIQINNGTVDSVAYTTGVLASDSAFYIGSLNALVNYGMDGVIDEVALWKRVLTATERTWLYNGGNGRTYTDLNPT